MIHALSEYARTSLRYARRNSHKVVLVSIVSVSAAAAVLYARRQYVAITEALDAERSHGARSLRAVYGASRRTVDATLRALLRPGRERVFSCRAANPDLLVARLKTELSGAEKKQTWEQLKVAAFVRLVVSVYYVVIVYVVLLVQVNLVARYSTADVDAPIEGLGSGELGLESKQRFLSLARRRLFEDGGIELLTDMVAEATEDVVGPVKLSAKVGADDVRDMLRDVCRLVNSRGGLFNVTSDRDLDAGNREQPLVLTARWLMADGDATAEDESVQLLVNEVMDLCEALGFETLIQSSVDALMDVAGAIVDGYVWDMSGAERGGKVALAPIVAKVANTSHEVLVGDREVSLGATNGELLGLQSESESLADSPFVGALLQLSACQIFGAGVFLSGERDSSGTRDAIPSLQEPVPERVVDHGSRRSSIRHESMLGEIQNTI
jgi:hypothetical protein